MWYGDARVGGMGVVIWGWWYGGWFGGGMGVVRWG